MKTWARGGPLSGMKTLAIIAAIFLAIITGRAAEIHVEQNPLALPKVGDHELRILAATLLELTLITSKEPDPAAIAQWNFVNPGFTPPASSEFVVTINGKTVPVEKVGFKRRTIYAPLKTRDLRIGSHLYLQL